MLRNCSLPLFVALVAVVGVSSSAPADVFTVHDRFGLGDTWNGSFARDIWSPPGNNDLDAANGFTVPTTHTGVTLNTVEVAFLNPNNNNGDSDVQLTLHSDLAGEPGAVLETFTFTPAPKPSSGIYLLNSVATPALTPGNQYWLVATAPGDASELGWYWNGVDPFFTPNGPSLVRADLSAWQDASVAGQQAFRITANGTPVPEPTTLTLTALGLLAVGCRRRRRA